MQYSVYILRCRDGSYYTGHTDKPLELRVAEHEQGFGGDWTRCRRPVELVWSDVTSSRYEALEFERRVKNWSRAKKDALIAGDWARVGYFARPPRERPSTTLGTNESSNMQSRGDGHPAWPPRERPSTALGTNESADRREQTGSPAQQPFAPSAVEGRRSGADNRR